MTEYGLFSVERRSSRDVAATVTHVLEDPGNYLISEVAMRPLRPKG